MRVGEEGMRRGGIPSLLGVCNIKAKIRGDLPELCLYLGVTIGIKDKNGMSARGSTCRNKY